MNKQPALHLKQPAPDAPQKPAKRDPNDAGKRAAVAAEAASQDSTASSTQGKGVVSMIGRAWNAFKSKPDHSPAGLDIAIRKALTLAEEIDYVSADHMCEEIEHEITASLNAPGGVYVEYIGAHKKDRRPRLLIVTNWGLRRAIFTLIGFSMVHAPERRRER